MLDTNKKNLKKNDINKTSPKIDYTMLELFKILFLFLLPLLAILALFLIYTLIGAAILKEIEVDVLNKEPSPKTRTNTPKIDDYETKLMDNHKKQSYQSFLLLKQQQIKLNNIHLDTLLKLKEFQEKMILNYDEFMANYYDEIDRSLFSNDNLYSNENINKSINTDKKESVSNSYIKSLNDTETLKFISQVYRKQQKKNSNAANLFRTIAKHLVLFKHELKTNLKKNVKTFADEFKLKNSHLEKNLFDFVNQQEILLRDNDLNLQHSTSDHFEKIDLKEQNNEIILNNKEESFASHCDANNNCEDHVIDDSSSLNERLINNQSAFIKSLYFIATLLTTIGKLPSIIIYRQRVGKLKFNTNFPIPISKKKY